MQETRGCGFISRPDEGEHIVRHDKKNGGQRYILSECPVSVLGRERVAMSVFSHWQVLGRPPFDYNAVGQALWMKTSALAAEARWAENQVSTDDH